MNLDWNLLFGWNGWKIILIILVILLIIHFLSTSYEYYDNFQDKKHDQYDELEVKLHDEVFDFNKLYQVDVDSIHNFLKTRIPMKDLENKDLRLLDAGCGLGKHYQGLSKNYHVIGVDRSPNMLDIARAKNPLGEFKKGRLEDVELFGTDNANFTAVSCLIETLHQNPEDKIDKILKNFHNWLKPGGYLFLHIFDPTNLDPAPREFSQYYTDGDDKHALTYFNDFTHDAWWAKVNDRYYKYCQKYIIENGKAKVKIHQMYIPPVKDTIQKVLDNGFKLIGVKDLEKANIEAFRMYVFSKK